MLQYVPKLQKIYIQPFGYNGKSGLRNELSPTEGNETKINTLESVKFGFSVKPIHIDGDILKDDAWGTFKINIINVEHNNVSYSWEEKFNLISIQNPNTTFIHNGGFISNDFSEFLHVSEPTKKIEKGSFIEFLTEGKLEDLRQVKIYYNNDLIFESNSSFYFGQLVNRSFSQLIIE